MQSGNSGLEFEAVKNSFVFYKTVTSQYRDPKVMSVVKKFVPLEVLEGDLMPSLLNWFNNFMTWTPNKIVCERCSAGNEQIFMQTRLQPGTSWKIRKTEIHTCKKCGAEKVIPRHSDVLGIAETRYGRCGEWSILFGAVLASLSIESRIAYDYLDHCWNEVFLGGRWFHTDTTFKYPSSLDNPLYYEKNWHKEYVYVMAFSPEEIEDVTERYTEQWHAVMSRRRKLGKFEGIDMSSREDLRRLYAGTKSLYDLQV